MNVESIQLSEFKEVAAPIEETVAALDMPEENISTLLCYLENSSDERGRQWLKLHNPVYSLCKIRDGRLTAEFSKETQSRAINTEPSYLPTTCIRCINWRFQIGHPLSERKISSSKSSEILCYP